MAENVKWQQPSDDDGVALNQSGLTANRWLSGAVTWPPLQAPANATFGPCH